MKVSGSVEGLTIDSSHCFGDGCYTYCKSRTTRIMYDHVSCFAICHFCASSVRSFLQAFLIFFSTRISNEMGGDGELHLDYAV